MKAAVLTQWEKIEIKDVPIPDVGEEECLIKVKYAGVCGSDLHIYNGHHATAKAPVILCHEFVGVVEKINSKTRTDIQAGDRVVVEPLLSCGVCEACRQGNWHVCKRLKLLGIHTDGGFAEYVKVSAEKIIKVNEGLSDKVAALTEPFAVGFHVNQRANVRNGDKILVIGGGPIGLIIGMVAKLSGASMVVFSEINSTRIEQIKSFGFDSVINPAIEDGVDRKNELTENEGFDVVFEVSGSQPGIKFATQACKIRGTVVPVGFPSKEPTFAIMDVIFKELTIVGSRVYTFEDFKKTVKMMNTIYSNKLFDIEKLISDIYSLEDVEKALLTMKEGKNLGKIIIEC